MGAALFERNNRAVALTPIGRQLLADLRPVYRGPARGHGTGQARRPRQVVLAVAADHPLAGRASVSYSDLAGPDRHGWGTALLLAGGPGTGTHPR
ncbi:hypothetical protein AB0C04_17280 [Micromonospora sp. NPDC048909]|uniref:hypothetical protein n=1 Tax=Micromonospora sp. NPDC048909 TaxID=3155643 RepID=UPI0033FD32E2